jgi:hypothetical protein
LIFSTERGETKFSEKRLQEVAEVFELPKESIEKFSDKIFIQITGNTGNYNGNIKTDAKSLRKRN